MATRRSSKGMATVGGGESAPPRRVRILDRLAHRTWLVAAILIAAVALVYANAVPNQFVFDDYELVVDNPQIQSLERIPEILGFGDARRRYRPVRFVSYTLDHLVFGLDPRGFHFFNVVYHALCTWLVFLISRRLFGNPTVALLAALLFAVHPVATDAVTYISGRRDLLSTLFYLIGFHAFLRYRGGGSVWHLAIVLAALVLGVFSKEMAATLPLMMFLYDACRLFPTEASGSLLCQIAATLSAVLRRHYRLYAPVFLLAALFLVDKLILHNPSRMEGLYGDTVILHALTMARVFVTYLGLLVWPVSLNADYSYATFAVSTSAIDPLGLGAAALLIAIWAGLVAAAPRARLVTFCGLWFFVCLLPVSQIVPHHELMAEHYLYLPSIGFFWLVALGVDAALRRPRSGVYAATGFAIVLALLSTRTVIRNFDWRDNLSLWQATVETAPRNARARDNLGTSLARAGNFERALAEFEAALQISPRHLQALHHAGDAYYQLGRFDEAQAAYEQALAERPDLARVQFSLGRLLARRGSLDEALAAFESAVRAKPRYTAAHEQLATAYYKKRRLDDARTHFVRALEIEPGRVSARRKLGIVETERGNAAAAIDAFEAVLAVMPGDVNLHLRLGQLYSPRQPVMAINHFRAVLRRVPGHPQARRIEQALDELLARLEADG